MTHLVSEFINRTTPQTHHFQNHLPVSKEMRMRVQGELRQRGAVTYDFLLPETRYLPRLLHPDEEILGSVYGHYKDGRGALIATNQRVLFIDKKPLFLHCDEISLIAVRGVTYTKAGIFAYVTLHTRQGDFKLRTINRTNASNFVDYIETKCLQNPAATLSNWDK